MHLQCIFTVDHSVSHGVEGTETLKTEPVENFWGHFQPIFLVSRRERHFHSLHSDPQNVTKKAGRWSTVVPPPKARRKGDVAQRPCPCSSKPRDHSAFFWHPTTRGGAEARHLDNNAKAGLPGAWRVKMAVHTVLQEEPNQGRVEREDRTDRSWQIQHPVLPSSRWQWKRVFWGLIRRLMFKRSDGRTRGQKRAQLAHKGLSVKGTRPWKPFRRQERGRRRNLREWHRSWKLGLGLVDQWSIRPLPSFIQDLRTTSGESMITKSMLPYRLTRLVTLTERIAGREEFRLRSMCSFN